MSHKTIKIDANVHDLFKRYCLEQGVLMGAFAEGLVLCALSGSISGSRAAKMAFADDYNRALKG